MDASCDAMLWRMFAADFHQSVARQDDEQDEAECVTQHLERRLYTAAAAQQEQRRT
jgi:hypothetical protein